MAAANDSQLDICGTERRENSSHRSPRFFLSMKGEPEQQKTWRNKSDFRTGGREMNSIVTEADESLLEERVDETVPDLGAVLESLDINLALLSAESLTVQYASNPFLKLFGCSRLNIQGGTLEEFFLSRSHHRDFFRYASRKVNARRSYSSTINMQARSGEVLLVEVRISEYRCLNDNISRWLFQVSNVEKKHIEEQAFQRHSVCLEKKITALENENKDLMTFTFSASHDLKAPLLQIIQFQEILSEELGSELPERQEKLLNRVKAIATDALQSIRSLADLSRTYQESRQVIRVNFSQLVQEILHSLAGDRIRDGQLTVHIRQKMEMFADRDLMRIALKNLLGNALKFTSKTDRPVIIVSAVESAGQTVYYIKDNGVGFQNHYAEKVFEPFERLHDKVDYEGSGLGLAIVRRIIRSHHGRIWAKGKAGSGATFFFTLGSNGR